MTSIDREMTIQELLNQHPRATVMFIARRMLCVGCPAQAFHTLEDVARIHGSTAENLCQAIQEAIEAAEEQPADSDN
jgi:hybrid cluster-associated redox disulfide protein